MKKIYKSIINNNLLFSNSRRMTPFCSFMKALEGGEGGGGALYVSFEVKIAVMLLLVKCYDKKWLSHPSTGHLSVGSA